MTVRAVFVLHTCVLWDQHMLYDWECSMYNVRTVSIQIQQIIKMPLQIIGMVGLDDMNYFK